METEVWVALITAAAILAVVIPIILKRKVPEKTRIAISNLGG